MLLYKWRSLFISTILFLIIQLCQSVTNDFEIPDSTLTDIRNKYGDKAVDRVKTWKKLIDSNQDKSEQEKLELVNAFINEMKFVDDMTHWGKSDYWATPLETLASNGGDCEDFSIAKYFTLRALNVPEEHLRLTYVKSLKLNQAHMVLTYINPPGSVPLVLDNLVHTIALATRRTDLLPVYSFNVEGLWLAKQRGIGQYLGAPERINLWQELLHRMKTLNGN